MFGSLPMCLTFARIAAIPLLVVLFYLDGEPWRYAACALYTAAAVTDYLDGYFARAWKQQSKLGRMFDPIADKLLVASTILLLVAFRRVAGIDVLAALVILCREVLVSGLREFLAELRAILPVSRLAKWKTGMQMTALGFLIVGDAQATAVLPVLLIGEILLWIAAALTLITGYDYLAEGLKHIDDKPVTHGTRPAPPAPAVDAQAGSNAARAARPAAPT
ncbi:MAG: CDP-diacylglycerol--glycerol-3-phosphate 3-phosphatidyltransferase [Alphaproteobacteria bacterium]|nr:CDP-diacylglycerol--glycerol-3-phosphate 3-phosphatidyltransferase [Alphaproteobacteria bacterium]